MTSKPVTAHDLKAEGAMAAASEGRHQAQPGPDSGGHARLHPRRPVRQHRPRLQLRASHGNGHASLSDYTVTEAGFAADLGAEKFLDIKCRAAGFHPDAVVIVATVRALKYHGGVPKTELNNENLEALEKGLPNLLQHVDNVKNVYGLPCVVAVNAFPTDTEAELDARREQVPRAGRQRPSVARSGPRAARAARRWPRRSSASARSPNALPVRLRR